MPATIFSIARIHRKAQIDKTHSALVQVKVAFGDSLFYDSSNPQELSTQQGSFIISLPDISPEL
jgi:hypothetical protein